MKRGWLTSSGLISICLCLLAPHAAAEPWWEEEKTRWFWAQWGRFTPTQSWEDIMRAVSTVGATVCVDDGAEPFEGQVQRGTIAHRYGLRYLTLANVHEVRQIAEGLGARLAVNRRGLTSLEEQARGMKFEHGAHVPCPLDEGVVDEWIANEVVRAAESGVIDGCHIDWESYGGMGFDQLGDNLCYCDHCFDGYVRLKDVDAPAGRAERYGWLQEQGLLADYLVYLRDNLSALYRSVGRRVREVRPDFVFSAYMFFTPGDLRNSWRFEGAILGLHSPSAPYFFIDPSHYYPNHSAPWWETSYPRIKKLGMKHILGSWVGGLYGDLPQMEVSASQWMYEAAMSHDGYWVWYEHRFGPADTRMLRAADKRIAALEGKAGDLLLKGRQAHTFACLVEQSGHPDRQRRIRQRTFHAEDRTLAWIFNANTDHAVTVLARFPRLTDGGQWGVRDLSSDLPYAHAGNTVWTSGDLADGVILALEKRSDVWLLIEPGKEAPDGHERPIPGDRVHTHPQRPATEQTLPQGSEPASGFTVLYTKQFPLELYKGGTQLDSMNPVYGTAVHAVDVSASRPVDRRLFEVNGFCRGPRLSPDCTRIVFSCWINGIGQIYVMNADGSDPVNLSANGYCDTGPVWSPDGRRVAFSSDRDGDWNLYLMDAGGGGQRRLTGSPGIEQHPTWSPDGKNIAFVGDRSGDFDLYVMDVDDAEERRLTDRAGNEYEPCWSPDGSRIACAANTHGSFWDIMVVDSGDAPAGEPRFLIQEVKKHWYEFSSLNSIAWSPDGNRIAAAFEDSKHRRREKSGVLVATLEPARAQELVAVDPLKPKPGGTVPELDRPRYKLIGGWYFDGNASRRWLPAEFGAVQWSPDGDRIAFRSDMDPGGYDFLFTMARDGTDMVRVDESMNPAGRHNALAEGK